MKNPLLLLRIGVAFSFAYAAASGFLNPTAWVGFFPPFLTAFAPAATLLAIWGVLEVVLALALLFMKDVFYPALIAAVLLLGVTLTNWGAMDIVFRDISIALAAIALAFLSRENRSGVGTGSIL
jgi:hypothetical protein